MLRTVIQSTPIKFLEGFENFVMGDYHRTKKFLNIVNPEMLEEISRKKAFYMFKLAAKATPAYKKFLETHNIDPGKIKSIADFETLIPETDKVNYIKQFSFEERCRDGHLPLKGNIDESGGTSGKATNWIHNYGEEDSLFQAINFELNYVFEGDKKNFIVISAWSTGPWATGVKFCELMERIALVKNTDTDPNDIIETLKMFGKEKNYLIGGYPPFIKNLLEDNKDKINWKEYNIDLVTGGEGNPIEWVYYVKNMLKPGSKVVSSYGASDIDIGVGFETPLCFFIREMASKDENLRIELFGKDELPMVFQYNPGMHYIQKAVNPEGKEEFLVTVLDKNTAFPKIKYNLHDEGKKYSYHEMINVVFKHKTNFLDDFSKQGGNVKDILHLPFLCIFGRSDGTLSFDGANVFPDQIQGGILNNQKLAKITNRFKMEKRYDKKHTAQFHIHIELKAGNKVVKKMENEYLKSIIKEVIKVNPDFRESYSKNKTLEPIIHLYPFDNKMFKQDDKKCKNIYFSKNLIKK